MYFNTRLTLLNVLKKNFKTKKTFRTFPGTPNVAKHVVAYGIKTILWYQT